MVSGGHMTNTPPTITFDSVVSYETVILYLMMAALHDLSVKNKDIINDYIKENCEENFNTILGK